MVLQPLFGEEIMNNTNMSDKEIIKVARIAGIKLNSIKTTDLEGRFPPHIGGFSYDSEQIKYLSNFANEFVANMQKTIDDCQTYYMKLHDALNYADAFAKGNPKYLKSNARMKVLDALALSSPISEKAK